MQEKKKTMMSFCMSSHVFFVFLVGRQEQISGDKERQAAHVGDLGEHKQDFPPGDWFPIRGWATL